MEEIKQQQLENINLNYHHVQGIDTSGQYWPNSSSLRDHLAMPLTLAITPFSQHPYCTHTVTRCQSCKAFLNKFCKIKNQNEYQCSICGSSNYTTQKVNFNSIQLIQSNYSFQASESQQLSSQKCEPLLIFIIDLSTDAYFDPTVIIYSIHLLKQFLAVQYNRIKQNPKEDIKVMLITFDDYVHQYQFQQNSYSRIIRTSDYETNLDEIQIIVKLSQKYHNLIEILVNIQQEINKFLDNLQIRPNYSSKAILSSLQYALKNSITYTGKIYLISSINAPLQSFKLTNHLPENRDNYTLNKIQCLSSKLMSLLQKTQMSISVLISHQNYINIMPFHIITKITNGELRRFDKNQPLELFYQLRYLLGKFNSLRRQTLLRVRYSSGLKFIGAFGNYRQSKITDQIQLLSCPQNRRYLLEFVIQGRITQPFVIIQLSVIYLYQDKRYFNVITIQNKLSDHIPTILQGINYPNICYSYLRAIIHNLDVHSKIRNLQLALQQRCRKHLSILMNQNIDIQKQIPQRKYSQGKSFLQSEEDQQQKQLFINSKAISIEKNNNNENYYYKNGRSYTLMTFYLLRNIVLNSQHYAGIAHDKTIEIRNKIATLEQATKKIWPLYYAVSQSNCEVVQAIRKKIVKQGEIGIIADFGDRCLLYLKDLKMIQILQKYQSTQIIKEIQKIEGKFTQLGDTLQKILEEKQAGYLPILVIKNLNNLVMLDEEGPFGYSNFIGNITSIPQKQ